MNVLSLLVLPILLLGGIGPTVAYAEPLDGVWAGALTCSENLINGNRAYSTGLEFRISGANANSERADAQSVETFSLLVQPSGAIEVRSVGRLRSDTYPRWITSFGGVASGSDRLEMSGQMFSGDGRTLVRERCSITLNRVTQRPVNRLSPSDEVRAVDQPLREPETARPAKAEKYIESNRTNLRDGETQAVGTIACSASSTGQAEYTQVIKLRFDGSVAHGIYESGETHEIHELVLNQDGSLRFSSAGVHRLNESRWFIRGDGRITGQTMKVSGKMYDANRQVFRKTCTVTLESNRVVELPSAPASDSFPLETVGSPLEFSASTLWGQRAFREWNFEFGMPWSFRGQPTWSSRPIGARSLKWAEKSVASDLRSMMFELPIKAIVLVDAGQVVTAFAKPGITASTLLPSASMSKNVTALAVGKAICSGRVSLGTQAADLIPGLQGAATGRATLRQILLMSSGSAETETQHTSGVTFREAERYLQSESGSLEDLITDPRLVRAKVSGATFDYKSYDPYLAALMVEKATGQKFTNWLRDTVFKEAGLESAFVLDTDRHGNFLATAGVRLTLADWIRLGIYVQEQRDVSGCFGDFVRDMLRPLIRIPKMDGVNGHFNGYGYFTWTDADLAPEMGWIAGHFGQRIGVSSRPGNTRLFITFGDGTDPAMRRIYPLAKRWIN
jgi:hypothetical protein